MRNEHIYLKNEAEEIMQNVDEIVLFERGSVLWKSERYENWKVVWQMNRVKSFHRKRLQSEVPKMYGDRDHGWLECNTDRRKTASIFSLQEHMIETRAWKKMRGLVEQDNYKLCGSQGETVHHRVAGCSKLASTEYTQRHNKALMILAVQWGI